jgi:hypothetical protein
LRWWDSSRKLRCSLAEIADIVRKENETEWWKKGPFVTCQYLHKELRNM